MHSCTSISRPASTSNSKPKVFNYVNIWPGAHAPGFFVVRRNARFERAKAKDACVEIRARAFDGRFGGMRIERVESVDVYKQPVAACERASELPSEFPRERKRFRHNAHRDAPLGVLRVAGYWRRRSRRVRPRAHHHRRFVGSNEPFRSAREAIRRLRPEGAMKSGAGTAANLTIHVNPLPGTSQALTVVVPVTLLGG